MLHPGAHTGSGEEAGLQRIADALNRIHAQLPECADVVTLLELMAGQGTTLGYTFAQLAQIIALVEVKERVGVCLDTCHALAAGYDFRTEKGYEAMMAEIEETVGIDSVGCWHFNDSANDHGSRKDRHAHIGEGFVGAEGFRHILNDIRWDGVPMLLETPKKEDGDGKDLMNLRALAALVVDARPPAGRSASRVASCPQFPLPAAQGDRTIETGRLPPSPVQRQQTQQLGRGGCAAHADTRFSWKRLPVVWVAPPSTRHAAPVAGALENTRIVLLS